MVLYHCSFVIPNSYNEWNIFSFFKYKSFTSSKLLYGLKLWMLIVIAYIPLMLKKRQLSIIILQNSYLVSFKRIKKKIQKNTHDDPLLKILNLHGNILAHRAYPRKSSIHTSSKYLKNFFWKTELLVSRSSFSITYTVKLTINYISAKLLWIYLLTTVLSCHGYICWRTLILT